LPLEALPRRIAVLVLLEHVRHVHVYPVVDVGLRRRLDAQETLHSPQEPGL
jgi:hypothetical protein